MSTLPLLASLATFVGAVCLMGGTWAWIEVWRTQRRAAAEARREFESILLRTARCRLQAVIDAEVRLHGHSRLSAQLVADAMAEGVPA